jgi:hypothetical protein
MCVTSPAYFTSKFCGKEFYIFDQRRRDANPTAQPPVILPIVWARTRGAPPGILDLVQWQQGGMDPDYEAKGLRYLKKVNPREYERCVLIFADAIANARQIYPIFHLSATCCHSRGARMRSIGIPTICPGGTYCSPTVVHDLMERRRW